jgi:hypothetical protein
METTGTAIGPSAERVETPQQRRLRLFRLASMVVSRGGEASDVQALELARSVRDLLAEADTPDRAVFDLPPFRLGLLDRLRLLFGVPLLIGVEVSAPGMLPVPLTASAHLYVRTALQTFRRWADPRGAEAHDVAEAARERRAA